MIRDFAVHTQSTEVKRRKLHLLILYLLSVPEVVQPFLLLLKLY